MLRQGKRVLPACSTGKESVIWYEAENRVSQERRFGRWLPCGGCGGLLQEGGSWDENRTRSLPVVYCWAQTSGRAFGSGVIRKGSRRKGCFSSAVLLGSVEHPDTVRGLNKGQGFIQKQQALYKDDPGFRTDERYFEGVQRTGACSLMASCWIFWEVTGAHFPAQLLPGVFSNTVSLH